MEKHNPNVFIKKFFCALIIFTALALQAKMVNAAEEPQQNFHGFNLQGYKEDGQKAWDVNGDTADIKGNEIKLSNVNANAYGQEKVNVTADSGTIDQKSGNMQLNKDVIITSESGGQILTDSLNWNRTDNLVSTNDDVFITKEDMTASGKGMTAHTELNNAEIHKDVTVRVDTDPKKDVKNILTITSDGPMEMDQAKSMATFEKNVVAYQEGRTLKADRLEVYFDMKMKGIKEVVCIGNVEITQGENKTYAEKAVYIAAEQRVVLSGRPKMIMITEGNDAFKSFGK